MSEEKKLGEFEISKESSVDVEYKDGKLRLSAAYDGKGAEVGLYIDVEPDYFLDKLAEVIPGQIDDKIIALLKAAF